MRDEIIKQISNGETVLGIELGSTRIKAVLIDSGNTPIASGGFNWENSLIAGIWTYNLNDVWKGIAKSFETLNMDVKEKYNVSLTAIKSIGISGMMHGYLAFNKNGELLTPFRTWRNNNTLDASKSLTELFNYQIPQRWSIAHLYQAILNQEEHVGDISYITTLAGYVHWLLTGQKVLGVGDASGMFPIDLSSKQFNKSFINKFDTHIKKPQYSWNLGTIMPTVLSAGDEAGELTEKGALLLDPTGKLKKGVLLCPPEGDAGTGMVATNSVATRSGNVSAGTSVFAMIVLENQLSKVHSEIDLVSTPNGKLVAMVHSNNCTSDLNGWISLFGQATKALGMDIPETKLFETFMGLALKGDPDCGGLLSYGYLSGEHLTGFSQGRPLFVRSSNSNFTLENFMRTHLFSALCALRTGLNILTEKENVKVDVINGHGGFFKTEGVGQKIMAAGTKTPICIMKTAGEGGAWGIALLASFMNREHKNQTLPDFLNSVFKDSKSETVNPEASDVEGFEQFFKRYHQGLPVEASAVSYLN